MPDLIDILRRNPVLPILTLEREEDAEPLGKALLAGGLTSVEVTLRTAAALPVIRRLKAMGRLAVGVGTVLSAGDAAAAADAGADFLVTPGTTPALAAALRAVGLPALPGVATAGEAMAQMEAGFELLKFFPAEPMGGPETLKALAGPLARVRFCPTGGIGRDRAPAYLALPNVVAVGGSWIATPALLRAGDWAAIADNARAALAMRTPAAGRPA